MRIIERYIGGTVLWSIGLIFLVFLGLEIFIQFVSELSDIGNADYNTWQAFVYVLQLTPNQLYTLFPMMALLGSVIGLGVLATNNELTVMRASGVSIAQVFNAVLRVAILILILASVMGEVVGPYLQRKADAQREMLISGGQALETASGVWVRSVDDFIHINEVLDHQTLRQVTVYQFNKAHQLSLLASAERVDYVDGRWLMKNVEESMFQRGEVLSEHTEEKVWQTDLRPDLFQLGFAQAASMNLVRLWHYIQYRQDNGLQVSSYQLEFWKRLYQPFATIVMMLLAVPFVFFGSLRTVTMGLRVVFGVMVGIGFFIFNELLGQISIVYRIPAPLAALLPILLFGLIGAIMLKRAR